MQLSDLSSSMQFLDLVLTNSVFETPVHKVSKRLVERHAFFETPVHKVSKRLVERHA
jgi:ABC-type antimicrobial peptide transport system ATPase subunit